MGAHKNRNKTKQGAKRVANYYAKLDEVIATACKSQAEFCRQAGLHPSYYHVMRSKGELPSRDTAEAIDNALEGKGYYQVLAGYIPEKWEVGKVWSTVREALQNAARPKS